MVAVIKEGSLSPCVFNKTYSLGSSLITESGLAQDSGLWSDEATQTGGWTGKDGADAYFNAGAGGWGVGG